MKKEKVILIIRDGWGYSENSENNFLLPQYAPFNSELIKKYPNTLLDASGSAVGLPGGYQGNSEVGHMTIGSGRIIFQSLARINRSIEDGSFFNIKEFVKVIGKCKKNKKHLHLMGLIQTEGVHSHINHLFAILDLCKKLNFSDVYIHAFTDGRDAPTEDGINKIKLVEDKINKLGLGTVVTVCGRYYAMDRDQRWDRTKLAYDCIINGKAPEYKSVDEAIKQSYLLGKTDEFIVPCKLMGYHGIKEKDSIIFFNFRTDRTRQLTRAIVENKFEGWERELIKVHFVAMAQYYEPMNASVAFKDVKIKNLLGEVISKKGLKQLRISETEKYAHVTLFFNGQIENPYKGEDRILIQSPKVATYDLEPKMSAVEIADRIVQEINKKDYSFVVTNLVNCDMVGHTGKKEAIITAVKTVDECTGKIVKAGLERGYTVLVTADHGNAESKEGITSTSHTTCKVPFILVSDNLDGRGLFDGRGLSDIAPTILELLGIKKPKDMTGQSLIVGKI